MAARLVLGSVQKGGRWLLWHGNRALTGNRTAGTSTPVSVSNSQTKLKTEEDLAEIRPLQMLYRMIFKGYLNRMHELQLISGTQIKHPGREACPSGKWRCWRTFGRKNGTKTSECPKRPLRSCVTSCAHTSCPKPPICWHQYLPVEKRVALTIYRLASNVEFHDVANLFGIGTSTACNIFWEVCEALSDLRKVFVRGPKSVPEVNGIIHGFERKTSFPMCVGALDGTHIPIIAPQNYPTDYYNRKGWYSVVLQGLVDHNYRFMDFDVGWPGKCHDAHVFECSRLCRKLKDGTFFPPVTRTIQGVNVPALIVADSTYSLTTNVMKPFPDGAVRGPRVAYNARLSRARIHVEHAFGRLKGRWRCIMKRNDSETKRVKHVVAACVVLHNFCELENVAYQEHQEELLEQPEAGPEQQGAADDRHLSPAERIRKALVAHVNTLE